jgi:ribosomal protein S18 acetylase RimI-like enzyme
MGDIVIKPLRTEDAPQWRELRLEALRTHPTAFAASYEEALEQDLAAFAARIPPADSPSVLFGAFHDGVLSGSAGVHVHPTPKQRHKAQLWGMYVAPSLRRHGVGASLLRCAIDHARTRVAVLQLVVNVDNVAARALYRGFGFEAYGIERRGLRVGGIDYDDELMAMHFAGNAQ